MSFVVSWLGVVADTAADATEEDDIARRVVVGAVVRLTGSKCLDSC